MKQIFIILLAFVGFSSTQLKAEPHQFPKNSKKLIKKGYVSYRNFGAIGDGKTDDMDAIIATHAFANEHNLQVKADKKATYYIGGADKTAVVKTNTDFGTAKFIIDDTNVENRNAYVFLICSDQESFKLGGISSIQRNQEKVDVELSQKCLITVKNSNVKHYIRMGLNQDNGASQTDIFILDKNGNVDMDAPIIWDFDEITEAKALPIDEQILTIAGGYFTTIANRAESKYTYYSRGFGVKRSNVVLDGITHHVEGEGEHGAPYRGFINVEDCAYVTIKNIIFTGHKAYRTIGSAGRPVSMGTYDVSMGRSLNITFENCSQSNSIDDRTYWGLMGSNYCKNIVLDNCTFSRFDAHKGVANATIRNSTLGHMGINAIGSGIFTVENSTIRGGSFINLRQDYGSTWEGEFHIRNCVFVPSGGRKAQASLINGYYSGKHNFGYTCYMPERIVIENLRIDDSNHPEDYNGPAIFSNFNRKKIDASYKEEFPYVVTNEVILKNVTTESGKALRVSDNLFMFKDVVEKREE